MLVNTTPVAETRHLSSTRMVTTITLVTIALVGMVAVFGGHQLGPGDSLQPLQPVTKLLSDQGTMVLAGSSVSKGWNSASPSGYPKKWGWCQRVASVLAVTQGLTLNQLSVGGSSTNLWLDPNNADMGAKLLVALKAKPKLLLVGLSLGNQGITETTNYTEAAAVGVLFVNGLKGIAELGNKYNVPVVFGGVYGNADWAQHQTLVTYEVNDQLKKELPTWAGAPKYIEFLPHVVQCDNRNEARCGHWPTSVSNPGHNYEFNALHPNALGFMAMYRAVGFGVFQSTREYTKSTGACVASGGVTTTYAGDLDTSQLQWSGNQEACQALCTSTTTCTGYDFATQGTGLMSLKPGVERRCRIFSATVEKADGVSTYSCFVKPVKPTVQPTVKPTVVSKASCKDVAPPSGWTRNTCAALKANGSCSWIVRKKGICKNTCGMC